MLHLVPGTARSKGWAADSQILHPPGAVCKVLPVPCLSWSPASAGLSSTPRKQNDLEDSQAATCFCSGSRSLVPILGPLAISLSLSPFFENILFIFRKGKGGRKRERKNINVWLPPMHPCPGTWPASQACALTGNGTSNTLVCRPVLNPLSHTSQSVLTTSVNELYFSIH